MQPGSSVSLKHDHRTLGRLHCAEVAFLAAWPPLAEPPSPSHMPACSPGRRRHHQLRGPEACGRGLARLAHPQGARRGTAQHGALQPCFPHRGHTPVPAPHLIELARALLCLCSPPPAAGVGPAAAVCAHHAETACRASRCRCAGLWRHPGHLLGHLAAAARWAGHTAAS